MVSRTTDEACVLRLAAVRAQPWFCGAELTVGPGQCVAITAGNSAAEHFGDLVQGLAAPAAGSVSLCGQDWQALSVQAAYALRARTGRLAPSMHWIQNLNVDENVLLPALDRSRLPERALRAQALALAQQLGLDEVPRSRPHDTSAADLLTSAAVRAFLGAPMLVVVEPMADAPAPWLAGLRKLTRAACDEGTAVIWLHAAQHGGPPDRDLACDAHGSLTADAMLELTATAAGSR